MLLEKLTTAKIEWSKEGFPSSSQYQDKYFSLDGVAESKYVFIEGNQLLQQWQNYKLAEFNILETGFGSGLNFMVTFELWKQQIDKGHLTSTQLQYFSIENAPWKICDLKKLIKLWPQYSDTANLLVKLLPQPIPGRHLIKFQYKQHSFHLYLLYNEIELALVDLQSDQNLQINSFFLDGFSPKKNQSMWSEKIFEQLKELATNKATLATYTASSSVSKALNKNNFKVSKIKGFNTKREMITAIFENPKKKNNNATPLKRKLTGKKFAVIGAGLSGCITAAKLTQQGASVFLIESANAICQGASGNDYGLAYPRLSNGYDSSCLLHLTGSNFLQRELQYLKNVSYNFCGLKLQLGEQNPNSRINQHTLEKLNLQADFVEYKNHTENSDKHLIFHQSGQINPKSLAQAYLNQHHCINNIEYYFETKIDSLVPQQKKWKLSGSKKLSELLFDGVIVSSGFEHIKPLNYFVNYTKPVRGQIDKFKVNQTHQELAIPVCGSSYIIPNFEHQQWHYLVGASYEMNSVSTKYDSKVSEHHKQYLSQQLQLENNKVIQVSSRVGVRLASNDRIPIVGAVADEKGFSKWYKGQLKYSGQNTEMPVLEGLYVNIAHGSHGLTTIPILSEHLVKTIIEQPSPLHHCLQKAIFPQRFLQRKIRKDGE